MPSSFLYRREITFTGLDALVDELAVVKSFDTSYTSQFAKKGGKIGDTIDIRLPWIAGGRDGAGYTPEPLVDRSVPLTINQQSGVDYDATSMEETLFMDDETNRYAKNAGISIAHKVDNAVALACMQSIPNHVGTPGTTPGLSSTDAFNIYGSAQAKLIKEGFPKTSENILILNADMDLGTLTYMKQFFNPQDRLSKQWKAGSTQPFMNIKDIYTSENMTSQTIGTLGTTPAVSGAGQAGSTINLSGLTASVATYFKKGDVISFAGVYMVDAQTKARKNSLRQFTVAADMASDGSGLGTVSISPALVTSGIFQNVSGSPANGGLVNVYDIAAAGQSAISGLVTPQALLLNPNQGAYCSIKGPLPKATELSYEAFDKDTNTWMRFVKMFDPQQDKMIHRWDVYWGWAPLYAQAGCRISG